MSSLWTPGGEHRVPPPQDEPARSAPTGPRAGGGAPEPGGGGGDRRRDRSGREADLHADEEMRRVAEELLATPAADIVANHCYGMFELAALHLGARPPQLAEARVAIDALAAVVESLGERLGPAAPTLRDGLAQIRLAYVQIAATSGSPEAGGNGPGGTGG